MIVHVKILCKVKNSKYPESVVIIIILEVLRLSQLQESLGKVRLK